MNALSKIRNILAKIWFKAVKAGLSLNAFWKPVEKLIEPWALKLPVLGDGTKGMIPFGDAIESGMDLYLPETEKNDKALRETLKHDMVRSFFLYNANPEEYFLYDFRNSSHEVRGSFLTRMDKDNAMIKRVGLGENYQLLHNKFKFYEKFKTMFNREVCVLRKGTDNSADFAEFCKNNPRYIAKPLCGRGGTDVMIRETDGTAEGSKAEAEHLLSLADEWICEELIRQDPRMAVLNASSVNTVRIYSFMNKRGFFVFETDIRMGRSGFDVDNACSGGITAGVDPKTGKVMTKAFDKNNNYYTEHPDNHVSLVDFQVPDWDKLIENVKKVHEMIPFYPYVGWDFALSENGWQLVEGNWGNPIGQFISKKGIKKEFFELID